jgi:hypothetical protein
MTRIGTRQDPATAESIGAVSKSGMRARAVVLAAVVALLFQADRLDACSCAPSRICSELWTADVVFIGTAKRVVVPGPGSQRTTFEVEEHLRGEAVGRSIEVRGDGLGGSCDRDFEQGLRYLVLASRRAQDGTWRVFLCSNTDRMDRVPSATMAYIRTALTSAAPGWLQVNAVVHARRGGRTEAAALANAKMTLRGGGRTLTPHANQDVYEFKVVPPGEYVLSVEVPEGIAPIAPRTVRIGSAACAHAYVQAERVR